MDKERLKEFKQQIDFLDDSADMEDYHRLIDTLKNMYEDGWLKELVSTVEEQSEKINGMAHVIKLKNKEMRELSKFLKERNIPLKDLSPLITAMNHVQELERVNKQLKSNLSVHKGYYKSMIKINEDIAEKNKKYRELIKDMGQEIEVLTDAMSSADNADALNEEVIRLKSISERDCIHCNGKGFNGLDYCPHCNQRKSESNE